MKDSWLTDPLFGSISACAALRDRPLGFIDVGARGGVHPLVEPLAGVTAVLGFEPDEEECRRLQKEFARESPWAICELEPCALGATDGEATLHLLAAATNHSLLPPNEALTARYQMAKFRKIGSVPMRTVRLDDILFGRRAHEEFWGEFLKIDTQGTELDVIKGAQRTLAERTVAVCTEVEFCQVYADQPLFSDVERYLRGLGFSFYGFSTQFHRSRKQLDKLREGGHERLIWADAVFFKDPLPGGPCTEPLSPRAQAVLFVCALLLGYYDFALELGLETWPDPAEAQRVMALVHHLAAMPPAQSYNDAIALAERVRARPELANMEVGRFVDDRRQRCDYQDVVLPSQH